MPWAFARQKPSAGLIVHSDRGSQYCECRFSYQARRIRHDPEHVTARQLLRQRSDGEFLLKPERRVSRSPALRDARGCQSRRLRVRVDVLQSGPVTLEHRLPAAQRVRVDAQEGPIGAVVEVRNFEGMPACTPSGRRTASSKTQSPQALCPSRHRQRREVEDPLPRSCRRRCARW